MNRTLICFFCWWLASNVSIAQAPLPKGAAEGLPRGTLPADLLLSGWLAPPFIAGVVTPGAVPQRPLTRVYAEGRSDLEKFSERAHQIVALNKPLGILFLDQNSKIYFEKYNKGATEGNKIIGYSLSKSVTSLAVGKALCQGNIGAINDLVTKYDSIFDIPGYRDVTIKDLLTMASGGMAPLFNGQPVEGVTSALLRYRTLSIKEGIVEYGKDKFKASKNGQFMYKNFDTYSLGLIVSSAVRMPFHEYFAKAVWHEIGAQSEAAWLLDKDGLAATADGFGATVRDWGRLSLYIMDKLESSDDPCFKEYLKSATSKQIVNNSNMNRDFGSYGYQFWLDNISSRQSFWMMGYAGQMIIINPEKGRVMVVLSNDGGNTKDYISLFNDFLKIH